MDENQTSTPQETSGNKNMVLISVVAIVVVAIIGLVVIFAKPKTATAPATTETTNSEAVVSPTAGVQVEVTQATEEETTGKTVTFNVAASSFKFNPAEIRVKKGDTVKVVVTNAGGVHDFLIDEFDVQTKQLQSGQSDTVEFVADKTGTFEYYCSVGNHRQMGMVGKLIVE